jgi:crossover junction endodeoxyribonuclease RuvC
VASGTISTLEVARGDLPGRLKTHLRRRGEVAQRYEPAGASVEIVFVNVNPQSTLLLGQARGAALAALVSCGLPVAEYTALQMKKAIVGHGLATKTQVQEMVMRLLGSCPACPARTPPTRWGWPSSHAHAGASISRRWTLKPTRPNTLAEFQNSLARRAQASSPVAAYRTM